MWSVVLITDAAGVPVGEVANAYQRSISFRLNRPTTSRFRVRLDDPLADLLLEGELLVKQYEDDELRLVGEIVGAEEKAEGSAQDGIEVTVSDPFSRLELRMAGKSSTGYQKTTPTDRGAVAAELIDDANAFADTGIRVGTIAPSASDTVGPWYFKPISEAITELSGALDGFDWSMLPNEPVLDGSYPFPQPAIATFHATPFIGDRQAEAVFEFGIGRHNVRSYTRSVNKQALLNNAFSLPSGFPDAAAGAVQGDSDTASMERWGVREAIVQGDLSDEALRLKLVQEHVRVRRNPRQVITFVPVREDVTGPPVPKFKQDYDIGDIVTFRAVSDGRVRVDAQLRVYGVDLTIDEQGAEQPAVTLAPGET